MDPDIFWTKYMHCQLVWVNYIPFCIPHPLLEAACKNPPPVFNLKSHCHKSKLDCITYSFTHNVFSILEIIPRAYEFIITSLLLDEGGTIGFNISQFFQKQIV